MRELYLNFNRAHLKVCETQKMCKREKVSMYDKKNSTPAGSTPRGQALRGVLSVTRLAIASMAIIGGLRSAAAEVQPAKAADSAAQCQALAELHLAGGKIIFYHGASDPWYSIFDTLDYAQRNKAANPEFDSSRFYSVPNMGHCGNGGLELFDMSMPLVNWVENGAAPGAIVARDWMGKLPARPLCPWPQYGHYKGTGDPKDAANFECRRD